MLISLPTGTKIFNWLTTFYFNNIGLTFTHMFYSFVFLLMFTIGGLTGILLANASIDISLHDTYYVVAHFHYVLSLGAVIATFSGLSVVRSKVFTTLNLCPGVIGFNFFDAIHN
jgi:cytochrome c oxidase subunit 1